MNGNNQNPKKKFDNTKKLSIYSDPNLAVAAPSNKELEEVVLGAILLEGAKALIKITSIINDDSFYFEQNKTIYQCMLNLYRESVPIDMITIVNQAQKLGVLEMIGGAYYVASLTSRVASSANIEYHARMIAEYSMRRGVIKLKESIMQANDPTADIFDIIEEVSKMTMDVMNHNVKKREKGVGDIFRDLNKRFDTVMALEDGQVSGIPSGLRDVDFITNGWQNSDLIVLAARPAMGKSALLKTFLTGATTDKTKAILLFSLEMSGEQVLLRMISEDVGIPANQIMKKETLKADGVLTSIKGTVENYYDKKGQELFIIDDSAGLSLMELTAKAKRICSEREVGLIGIDYLQLLNDGGGSGSNRQVEVSNIAKGLKNLAKDLNIPVIALSQLSRSTEQNPNKKPTLSNLNESGAIEAAADVVCFLWRGEYYYQGGDNAYETVEHCKSKEMISCAGYAELIFAKNRNGNVGAVALKFDGSLTKFSDWSYGYQPPATTDQEYKNSNTLSNLRGSGDEPF